MKRFIFSIILGIALCSATTLYAEQNNFPLQILDGAGMDLAKELNAAYNNTPTSCESNSPVWHCSGVMLRAIPDQTDYFLNYRSSSEKANRALSFSYLRHDVHTKYLSNGISGLIINNRALSPHASIIPDCIFPFTSSIEEGTRRNNNGCGAVNSEGHEGTKEKSSCPAQMTAAEWLKEYEKTPLRGCSFSVKDQAAFNTALKTHNDSKKETLERANPVQLLTSLEDLLAHEGMHIQALYYDVTVTSGSSGSDNGSNNGGNNAATESKEIPAAPLYLRKYQYDFYKKERKFIPIIRVSLKEKDKQTEGQPSVFSYNAADQSGELRGVITAAALNARYAARDDKCDKNRPAYQCNGVVLRAVNSPNFFYDVTKRTRVAFSYFRVDLDTNKLAFDRMQGFIVDASGDSTYRQPITITCAFPVDGDTDERKNNGCGNNKRNNFYTDLPGLCKDRPVTDDAATSNGQMVTTLPAWQKNFNLVNKNDSMRYSHQCVFLPNVDDFALNLAARRSLRIEDEIFDYRQNEVVVQPWTLTGDKVFPLEAVFHTINTKNESGLGNAQKMQRDFSSLKGDHPRVVPVIYFDTKAAASGSRAPFVFRKEEQDAKKYPAG